MNTKINVKQFWMIALGYTAFVHILKCFFPSIGEFFIQIGYLAIVVGLVYFIIRILFHLIKKIT